MYMTVPGEIGAQPVRVVAAAQQVHAPQRGEEDDGAEAQDLRVSGYSRAVVPHHEPGADRQRQ
jgi:hypothetical protein